MKVGFIGAGRVGTAMGGYLSKKGIRISGYYSRSLTSSQAAANLTESQAFSDICKLTAESDLIGITTPDDLIHDTAVILSELDIPWKTRVIFHMSGMYASDVLSLLEQKGAAVCSLHPLLSFGDPNTAIQALDYTPFTLEGRGENLDLIKNILKTCGNKWVEIPPESKVLYHASACVLSNYLVTLLDLGFKMLVEAGFTEDSAKKMAEPLIRKTLDNILNMDTKEALTGPISRGDEGTVRKHLAKLQNCSESWLEIYKILGTQTVNLAADAEKIDNAAAKRMEYLLKQDN